MVKVRKYVMESPVKEIEMCSGAVVVSIIAQGEYPVIYVEENGNTTRQKKIFRGFDTGQEIPGPHKWLHRATLQFSGGKMVKHIYEFIG